MQIRAIPDAAAVAISQNQPCAGEYGKVGRQGVLAYIETCGDFARGKTLGAGADQQTKHVQARVLRQRLKREEGSL